MFLNKFISSFFFILIFSVNSLYSQGVLPTHRYHKVHTALDVSPVPSSFGFSLRKLSASYTDFALELRRSADNAKANVFFDTDDLVSLTSQVVISDAGSSGLSVGDSISLSEFKGTQSLFVSIWYDQGDTNFVASQTTNSEQPELQFNVAGSANDKPALSFNGSVSLILNEPIEVVLGDSGVSGTFMLALKTTKNKAQFTFGYRNASTNWRWSFHINWSNGYAYFDAAERCCAINRNFYNNGNVNLWKQYTFIRGVNYKTVRVSGTPTVLNNSFASSETQSGGNFQLGSSFNNTNGKFEGFVSELLMFPSDLSVSEVSLIELNQIDFWDL